MFKLMYKKNHTLTLTFFAGLALCAWASIGGFYVYAISTKISLAGLLHHIINHLGLIARKPVFGVSDKARQKPVSSATQTS